MTESFLVAELHKFSYKSKLRVSNEKVHPIDVAFMNNRKDAFSEENLGPRLETIVYIELLRRCNEKGDDVFYYADRSAECDFVVCDGDTVQTAIQVSYNITNPKTRRRELNGLIKAAQELGAKELLLLTDYEYDNIEEKGLKIAIRPTYEFLLTNEFLPRG